MNIISFQFFKLFSLVHPFVFKSVTTCLMILAPIPPVTKGRTFILIKTYGNTLDILTQNIKFHWFEYSLSLTETKE